MCHACASGNEPLESTARPGIARQRLASGELNLTKIEAIWQEADGSWWYSGRWYYLPEETHTGRQANASCIPVDLSNQNGSAAVKLADLRPSSSQLAILTNLRSTMEVFSNENFENVRGGKWQCLP